MFRVFLHNRHRIYCVQFFTIEKSSSRVLCMDSMVRYEGVWWGGAGWVSEKQCLHIKYSIFGKDMNECMSGATRPTECSLFVVVLFHLICERQQNPDFIVQWLPQICLWCEVAMVKHMRIRTEQTSFQMLNRKLGLCSLLRKIIGIPFNAPLPCNRPHTGKDTAPAVSQCCAPDVPTCSTKCDSPTHPIPCFLTLLTTSLLSQPCTES